MKTQVIEYNIEVEEIVKKALQIEKNCEDDYFLRHISSDYIEYPFQTMMIAIGYLYMESDEEGREKINEFINEFESYSNMTTAEILSFETTKKMQGMVCYKINAKNGEELIINMIEAFGRLF